MPINEDASIRLGWDLAARTQRSRVDVRDVIDIVDASCVVSARDGAAEAPVC